MITCRPIFFFFARLSSILAATAVGCFGQAAGDPKAPNGQDGAEEAVDDFKKFDLTKIEAVVEGFLKAGTVTERAKYVRHPKRVAALMMKYYGGEKFEAEGFEYFEKSEVSYRDNLLTSMVQLKDFTKGPIAIERIEGKPDVYLVDWESWVGYSEMTIDEMKKNRPVKPVLVRVIVARDTYFNFEFEDEKMWSSFKLSFRNDRETLSGYAKRSSEIGKTLAAAVRGGVRAPLTLKVAYPADARSAKSVEIVEVVSSGWVPGPDAGEE